MASETVKIISPEVHQSKVKLLARDPNGKYIRPDDPEFTGLGRRWLEELNCRELDVPDTPHHRRIFTAIDRNRDVSTFFRDMKTAFGELMTINTHFRSELILVFSRVYGFFRDGGYEGFNEYALALVQKRTSPCFFEFMVKALFVNQNGTDVCVFPSWLMWFVFDLPLYEGEANKVIPDDFKASFVNVTNMANFGMMMSLDSCDVANWSDAAKAFSIIKWWSFMMVVPYNTRAAADKVRMMAAASDSVPVVDHDDKIQLIDVITKLFQLAFMDRLQSDIFFGNIKFPSPEASEEPGVSEVPVFKASDKSLEEMMKKADDNAFRFYLEVFHAWHEANGTYSRLETFLGDDKFKEARKVIGEIRTDRNGTSSSRRNFVINYTKKLHEYVKHHNEQAQSDKDRIKAADPYDYLAKKLISPSLFYPGTASILLAVPHMTMEIFPYMPNIAVAFLLMTVAECYEPFCFYYMYNAVNTLTYLMNPLLDAFNASFGVYCQAVATDNGSSSSSSSSGGVEGEACKAIEGLNLQVSDD